MVAVMGMMMISSAFALAAFAATNNDIPQAQHDVDAKRAYSAAEAGIQWYLFHLSQDNAFWTYCASAVPQGQPNPIGQPGTLNFVTVPGSSEQYAIELVPQNGAPQCSSAAPQQTMIDTQTGNLQLRVTGRSNGVDRTLVATLRRAGFLDYLYFTDFETLDPITLGSNPPNCAVYRRDGRSSSCTNIQFITQDAIAGPLHTNDDLLVCGAPTFGRTANDSIEVSAPPQGWAEASNCSGRPNFVGTYKTNAPILSMPATNGQLATIAQSDGTLYTGATTITLQSSGMLVTNAARGWTNHPVPYPAHGVVYGQNGTCGTSYSLQEKYQEPSGCAIVAVQGNTAQSLTIASADDILITGNLTHSAGATLGLIPNNFVRIYHPINFGTTCGTETTGPYGASPLSITIDAAILSLQHSFIVDNYAYGTARGTLTVVGAIAQRFRGPVGTSGGQCGQTGYIKAYTYDDSLKVISPPSFLDPVQSAWQLGRLTEQAPPR